MAKKSDQFYMLKKCEITDVAVLVIADHQSQMACVLNNRISDLQEIDFPSWITCIGIQYIKKNSQK